MSYALDLNFIEGEPFSISDTLYRPVLWTASTSFASGRVVGASPPNGLYFSSGGGTSGSTQPTWPINPGRTVTDNTITWTCVTNATNYLIDFTAASATAKFRESKDSAAALLTLTESSGIALGAALGTIGISVTAAQITTLVGTATHGSWDMIVTFPGPTPLRIYEGHWSIDRSSSR